MKAGNQPRSAEVASSARHERMRRARPRTGGIHRRRHQDLGSVHVGDTVTIANLPARPRPCPATRRRSKWCSAGCTHRGHRFRKTPRRAPEDGAHDAVFRSFPKPAMPWVYGFRCGSSHAAHGEHPAAARKEAAIDLIQTAPNVTYELLMNGGEIRRIGQSAGRAHTEGSRNSASPSLKGQFFVPAESIGQIMHLCEDRRGTYKTTELPGPTRASSPMNCRWRGHLRHARSPQEHHSRVRQDGL